MQSQEKPNRVLNIVTFLLAGAGSAVCFGILIPILLLTMPIVIIVTKSSIVKSAAATALLAVILIMAVLLINAYTGFGSL